MCGACGGGLHDPMTPHIAGPRRRAAIAAAAGRQLPGVRIRAAERAWTVADRTGRVTVCRTFDQLLDALGRRGVPRAVAEPHLLDAAASVANSVDQSP